jgi:hypothetical protein
VRCAAKALVSSIWNQQLMVTPRCYSTTLSATLAGRNFGTSSSRADTARAAVDHSEPQDTGRTMSDGHF